MVELTTNDIFADSITDAYENYDKEFEAKILIEICPKTQIAKYEKELGYDDTLYVLVTINKQYQSISYISTEYETSDGEIGYLPSNYTLKEKELLKNYAIKKWRETYMQKI